jgi:acetoin utilization deacetylase AcuC-like enzyme
MRNKTIQVFYHPKMVINEQLHRSYSKSPLKPKLLLEKLENENLLNDHFIIDPGFEPFIEEDFKTAHREDYVTDFFAGKQPLCEYNGIHWTKEFAESVRYTNASLYHAIRHAVEHPETITFSPTSGFHHARPEGGSGFCTFSGQVIASLRLFRERGLSGAWLDLDQHFGNSIEDSRKFVPELNNAIPSYANFNPDGYGIAYVSELKKFLHQLEQKISNDEIHYLVWCHGADSHEWDNLGGRVSTEQWIECATVFYSWLKELEEKINKPVPLILSLFGGYRTDDYNSVLSLHIADLVECQNVMLFKNLTYIPEVKPKTYRKYA